MKDIAYNICRIETWSKNCIETGSSQMCKNLDSPHSLTPPFYLRGKPESKFPNSSVDLEGYRTFDTDKQTFKFKTSSKYDYEKL